MMRIQLLKPLKLVKPFSNIRSILAVLFASAICLAGCDTARDGCDICSTSAVAYGTVTAPDGSPVSGATVFATAYVMQADTLAQASGEERYQVDSDGMYRARPRSLRGPFEARIKVKAVPPEGSDWAVVIDTSEVVEYREDYEGPERDSVRVDLTLPHSR